MTSANHLPEADQTRPPASPRPEDCARFVELLRESERLGLKNDHASRFGQFECLYKAVFGDGSYPGIFSRNLVMEMINNAQNIIGFYCDWTPLLRLIDSIEGQLAQPGHRQLYDDALLSSVLDLALEWHLYENARNMAGYLVRHIEEADAVADDEERERRLKLGMRVCKTLYLEAECNPERLNEEEAAKYLKRFEELIDLLGFNYGDTIKRLKESIANYSYDVLPFINLIDKKVKPKKSTGNSAAVLPVYYNALKGILQPEAPERIRLRVFPYLLQKIFEYQVPRISEAVKEGKADKALEYTMTLLCCLGGIVPGKKADAESLRKEYLADGIKPLTAKIRKSIDDNIPKLTAIHFKGQEQRRFLLQSMADLVGNNWDSISETDPDCGRLLEWASLHLAYTFMANDCDKIQTGYEAVDAARLYYFFYERSSGRLKDIRWNLFTKTIAIATNDERDAEIESLRWRISDTPYEELFIELRHNPDAVLPDAAPRFVLQVRDGLIALKKQFDEETAKTGKGHVLHEAILDFLHYSADRLLKQNTSSTFDLYGLISDIRKHPRELTMLLNQARRIETILKFIHNSNNLPDEQFRKLCLTAIDTLKASKTKNHWALLGYAVNRHGSEETRKAVLNKLVRFERDFSYPAFNLVAIHWMLNHKGSLDEAVAPEAVDRYFSRSMASKFTAVNIYESFLSFNLLDSAKKKELAEKLIKWVETIRDNYGYPEGKEIIYPYLGLLYAETGDLRNANLNREMYLRTKPGNCKLLPAFHKLQERLTIIPRYDADSDNWTEGRRQKLAAHDTRPAKELVIALRHEFLYLLHSFDGQLNRLGRPLTSADLVREYRDRLLKRLQEPKMHFATGKLLYSYAFKDTFYGTQKSFGAARNRREWNAAIERLRSILETNGDLKARIIPENYRETLCVRIPEDRKNIYRAYWPSIQSALGSIIAECVSRSEGMPEVEVGENGEMLRIEVISHNSRRTADPTERIRQNILDGIGGHAKIAEALWGLCDFGLQYGTSEPAKVLGKVSPRTDGTQDTDLIYIIHLPSIKPAGLTDRALAAPEARDAGDAGADDLSMIL